MRFMKAHNIPAGELEKGKLRVLIIDSRTEYARQFADQLLNYCSFEIQCAHNSFDAGLAALKFSPNIILIDLMSREIDSGSICRYVRESEDLTDCRLIALSGGLGYKETEALKKQGFDDVITEPENMNAIKTCIQKNGHILI